MSGNLVPTVRTTYTEYDIVKALIQGWIANEGKAPNQRQIGVIWAQNSLETGQSFSMWNNNVANVKYTEAAGAVDYCMLANVWEIVNGKKVMFQPPNPATWFRSFPTLADGVTFQINFLKNKRYKTAWTAVESGNPAAFAHLLKLAGYYTAPEQDYVAAMNGFFNKFMRDQTFAKALADVQKPAIVETPEMVPLKVPPSPSIPQIISNVTTSPKPNSSESILALLGKVWEVVKKIWFKPL